LPTAPDALVSFGICDNQCYLFPATCLTTTEAPEPSLRVWLACTLHALQLSGEPTFPSRPPAAGRASLSTTSHSNKGATALLDRLLTTAAFVAAGQSLPEIRHLEVALSQTNDLQAITSLPWFRTWVSAAKGRLVHCSPNHMTTGVHPLSPVISAPPLSPLGGGEAFVPRALCKVPTPLRLPGARCFL
jgi:hypothetical protein